VANDDKALVPAEGQILPTTEDYLGERGPQHRGTDGLMLVQRQFLQELLAQGSTRKACDVLKIRERRVRGWLTEDDAFRSAFDNLFSLEEATLTRREMEIMSGRAAGMYDEALDAERGRKIKAVCPKCGERFEAGYTAPDWRIRIRAGDTILRAAKILQETKEIKGTVTHVNLTGAEAIALLAIRAGRPVPEAARAALRAKGIAVD
jgi:hypothetical protein